MGLLWRGQVGHAGPATLVAAATRMADHDILWSEVKGTIWGGDRLWESCWQCWNRAQIVSWGRQGSRRMLWFENVPVVVWQHMRPYRRVGQMLTGGCNFSHAQHDMREAGQKPQPLRIVWQVTNRHGKQCYREPDGNGRLLAGDWRHLLPPRLGCISLPRLLSKAWVRSLLTNRKQNE